MRALFFLAVIVGFLIVAHVYLKTSFYEPMVSYQEPSAALWEFQAIDTMKYSRDRARERLKDPEFDAVIQEQVGNIALTGATHVGIATPYDEEFFPFLERWVKAARAAHLKVWFRGNFAGWEKWFDYPVMTPEEHAEKTKAFILAHPSLFRSGDVFTSCPECENGAMGDPRMTGKVADFRQFLIRDYEMTQAAFKTLGLKVRTNFYSMNGDVARLVMDDETAKKLGGIVTVDHYVKSPEQLVADIEAFSKNGSRQVVLGEFGAPIPDIHGSLTPEEQASYIEKTLQGLSELKHVLGVSYWLSVGGTTEIWNDRGMAHPAVAVMKRYFETTVLYGFIRDPLGRPVVGASIEYGTWKALTDKHGYFILRYIPDEKRDIHVTAKGHRSLSLARGEGKELTTVTLEPIHQPLLYRFIVFLKDLLG